MIKKPLLNNELKAEIFLSYYWLKEELEVFCKRNNLSVTGSKEELTQIVFQFLKDGTILKQKKKQKKNSVKVPITSQSTIPNNIKCDENLRAFFKKEISDNFRFTVPFMDFLKDNHGKTLEEIIYMWYDLGHQKKAEKTKTIGKQFEYNSYFKDFFNDNPHLKKEDAITCWNYKKRLPEPRKYSKKDLDILKNI
jgi:hypothetical protein